VLPASAAWRFPLPFRLARKTANALMEKLIPRVEALKIGPYTAGDDVDFGPLVTAQAMDRVLGFVEQGVEGRRDACRRRPRFHHAGL
jgi:acyl-CoA reductase-like NAD-dependent aldehyde dehydrogenase